MDTSEKIAYLKGLAEGIGVSADSKEGKLFNAIVSVLESVSLDLDDLEEATLDLAEEMDAISDDLEDVENIVYDEDDDDECCCDEDDDELFYEATCPNCGYNITFEESLLDAGYIECPECGERLEFDLGEDCCCGDDDCCCGEHDHDDSCGCEH